MSSEEDANEETPRSPSGSVRNDIEKQPSKQGSIWYSETFTPLREVIFVTVICFSQFLTQAAFGQILFSTKVISEGLGTSNPGQQSWTIAAYSLTVGTFVLPAGRLGDIYGHKRLIVFAWAWFGLGSIIAGLSVFAPKGQGAVVMFCVFQGLRGIGPAILLPNSLAVLGRTYPTGKRKNMVFAMFAMTAPTGAILGGTFGAIFAQLAWWPWTLWSIGIVQLCVAVAATMVVPSDDLENLKKDQKFDLIGACLGVSGMILFNFAWNQAGVVGWADPYVPTLLAIGVLLAVAFFLYERKAEQPLLPPDVFNTGSSTALVVVSLGWASFGVFTYYLVQFEQNIRHHSLLNTIAQLSPIAISGVTAAVSTGRMISVIPAPWMLSIAAAAFTIGNILIATMPAHQIYWAQTFVATIIMPFGMDISFPAASLILSDMVPKHHQGVAASLVNTVINYSISIGLGVAGTAERTVHLKGASELHGYRVAMYTGIGMAGGALAIAVLFALITRFSKKKSAME